MLKRPTAKVSKKKIRNAISKEAVQKRDVGTSGLGPDKNSPSTSDLQSKALSPLATLEDDHHLRTSRMAHVNGISKPSFLVGGNKTIGGQGLSPKIRPLPKGVFRPAHLNVNRSLDMARTFKGQFSKEGEIFN